MFTYEVFHLFQLYIKYVSHTLSKHYINETSKEGEVSVFLYGGR